MLAIAVFCDVTERRGASNCQRFGVCQADCVLTYIAIDWA